MRESIRDYLRRRYRMSLIGVILGALLLISAPESPLIALPIVGAIVVASGLLIAARTRCPRCRALFDRRVIAAMVQYSHAPPARCPHCGVDLGAPRP